MSILEVRDLHVSVDADGESRQILRGVDLTVKAGDSSTIDFGAQPGSQAAETPVSEGGRSPLLGIIGIFVVLAGIGLGIYARVSSRR